MSEDKKSFLPAGKNLGKEETATQVAHDKRKQQKPQGKDSRESKDFRGILRLAGRDLDGHFTVANALSKIRGVGHNLAKSLVKIIQKDLGVNPGELLGNLSEEQLDGIEAVMRNPEQKGVKSFLLNRPRDKETGKPKHLIVTDLQLAVRQDITGEKEMRSWRGWRHSIGQKVRGQHTRSTGRTGMSVGVLKKALKQQKQGAASTAQDASKEKKEDKKK